jgi:hypothetical protein
MKIFIMSKRPEIFKAEFGPHEKIGTQHQFPNFPERRIFQRRIHDFGNWYCVPISATYWVDIRVLEGLRPQEAKSTKK